MPWLRQLEFAFGQAATAVATEQTVFVGQALRLPNLGTATDAVALQCPGCDAELEKIARDLLRAHGATRIARELRIEWNSRLKTAAGRADYRQKLISLNPRLLEHPPRDRPHAAPRARSHRCAISTQKSATDFSAWTRVAAGLSRFGNRRLETLSHA